MDVRETERSTDEHGLLVQLIELVATVRGLCVCLGGADECPDAAEVRRTLELLQHELRYMHEQELPSVDDRASQDLDTVPTIVENADEHVEQGGAVRNVGTANSPCLCIALAVLTLY
jgi:hypothetical protein